MHQFLDEQTESITEYDEQLTRRLIEKITVYEDHFTVGSNPEQAWKFIGKYRTMQQHLTAVEANKNTPHHRMILVARSVYVKSISVTD